MEFELENDPLAVSLHANLLKLLRPEDAELLMRRGAARRQQGNLLEAARDLETAIRKSGGKYPECQRLLTLTFNDLIACPRSLAACWPFGRLEKRSLYTTIG